MDTIQAIEIAIGYVDSLWDKYNIESAILFGSYVKGTNHEDSDIILKHINDRFDTQLELMKLSRQIDLRIEPHPFDCDDFDRVNPIVNEILKHGIDIKINMA